MGAHAGQLPHLLLRTRAPESAIMKMGLNSWPPLPSDAFISLNISS